MSSSLSGGSITCRRWWNILHFPCFTNGGAPSFPDIQVSFCLLSHAKSLSVKTYTLFPLLFTLSLLLANKFSNSRSKLGSQLNSCSLRTFVRKTSNINFFIKLLPQLCYELPLSEMQKNWGVTDFVSEIIYLKGHPYFEKSVFLTRYGSNVCMSKNIANESLEQNFLCQFLYEWVY